jgi:hypothetical protein
VLLALAQEAPPASPQAREKIRDEIEQLKSREAERWIEAVAVELRRVQQRVGAKAQALQARMRPFLETNA